ncbi:polysaccharide deacetylase family protein [Vulgatibacter incomptus]|nr:polysaccharide deacetylase family protein [Vulgatibacter incomptus]
MLMTKSRSAVQGALATAKRWAGAQYCTAAGRARRNKEELYRGAGGLRVLTFHETAPAHMRELARIVDWCRRNLALATPADADALFQGEWPYGAEERVLLTFDDGFESNFQAAEWLAREGIRATFFIVPSLVDRTLEEFLEFHDRRGVRAFPMLSRHWLRGLSSTQVREMMSMGHRIGAHNYSHRDLGSMVEGEDFGYEILNSLDAVSELTGEPCLDFATSFGQPENVSDEAIDFLQAHCPRVYSCHRGLNVPGVTPRFLLRHAWESHHPFSFTKACLDGSVDHVLMDRAREMVRRTGLLGEPSTIMVPSIPELVAEAG